MAIDVINGLLQGIMSGINNILGKINSISSTVGIPAIPTISAPQIPKLATGAVIPPRQEFMAILGDQKQGNNIETPENLLRQIVREESGNKVKTVIVPLHVDRRKIAEAVAEVEEDDEINSPELDGGGCFVY